MTVDGSNAGSPQVMVLRDGDAVPQIPGFLDQVSIEQFVGPYIDTAANRIVRADNQTIFLFELGVTDLKSPAADFQDLVVLVTLARHQDQLLEPTSGKDTTHLISADHRDGSTTPIMPLSRAYDGLATIDGLTFLASFDQ